MIRKASVDPWSEIKRDLQALETEELDPLHEGERILCADPSCVGTLGEDGVCRICGLSTEGEKGGDALETETQGESNVEENEGDSFDVDDAEEIDSRVLCSDESCVGTVGDDGYCRICGLKWKEEGYKEGEEWIYK